MPEIKDRSSFIGQRFGRLVAVSIGERVCKNGGFRSTLICKCDCGNIKECLPASLFAGLNKSCGCMNSERLKEMNTKNATHGLSKNPLYWIRTGMIRRCENSKRSAYKYYGERGIKVCDEWKNDFKTFYDWCMSNGYKKGLQIDRINNDGNYEPSNCRFVTAKVNANNRRKRVYARKVA